MLTESSERCYPNCPIALTTDVLTYESQFFVALTH